LRSLLAYDPAACRWQGRRLEMKRLLLSAFATVVVSAVPAAAELAQSGNVIVDLDEIVRPGSAGEITRGTTNILINPGFETGILLPWTTNNWNTTNADAHSGTWCAEDIGNFWIRQDFTPIDVNSIVSVSFWTKQPEQAIQAVDFYYGPSDNDQFIVFPLADWTLMDVTSWLRPAGNLQAIRIWGYSGGGKADDLTRIDDVDIQADVPVSVQSTTWGGIKGAYRE
jgi:hypothetical protein